MLEKITDQELDQYGVVSAPDELKGRPEDTKAVFDRLIREVVSKVVNDIIDAHNGLDEDVNERIDGVIEELKKVTEINAENLGSSNITLDKMRVVNEETGEKELDYTLANAYGITSVVPTVYEALAAALGKFVNKSGDTMTGALTIKKGKYPQLKLEPTDLGKMCAVAAGDRNVQIKIMDDPDSDDYRILYLISQDTVPSIETALRINDRYDGADHVYNVLHTGNLEALGMSRIVSGTVTGSSNAGEDSPNSITFPFKPKLVYVTTESRSLSGSPLSASFLWTEGVTGDRVAPDGYSGVYRYYELDGNTLSWWVSNTQYHFAVCGRYVAIG